MKSYIKKSIEQTFLKSTHCDVCKELIKVEPEPYMVSKTKITLEEGTVYPEGGDMVITEFDICSACFKSKLIPWFKQQGVEPNVEENNW